MSRIHIKNENVTWFRFLKIIISIIKQWFHWIRKTFFYWIFLSNKLFVWFFDFFLIVNLLIQSFEMKKSLCYCIENEKTSWRSRSSFTIVNDFFHAINRTSFMQKMFVFCNIDRENDHFDRFKIQIEFFVNFFFEIHRKRLFFINEKCCKS